ncbi:hypothetical protein ACFV3R_01210 [Streptomyces sp. NPDC059740]|uniref:hypothetical protein n=1 Tax=Streptomyces sp. NPDC059740 TaxID=3346926 RepID=UPI00364E987D
MANYQQPPGDGTHDPAGSTQMFRAFVDEEQPQARRAAAPAAAAASSGPRVGLIVGVVVAIAVVVAAVWLAL